MMGDQFVKILSITPRSCESFVAFHGGDTAIKDVGWAQFLTILVNVALGVVFLPGLLGAANPYVSISPTTCTLGVTSFTETYSGFTSNGSITEYDTYPDGVVHPYNLTANGSSSTSSSHVLQSQAGFCNAYAVDNATGPRSNTINWSAR